jgi:hypothetical protein
VDEMKKIVAIGTITMLILSGILFTGDLFCQNVKADTFVDTDITSDTTWTLNNSPYIITSAIRVGTWNNGNVALTIEPGVTIKFAAGSSLTINGNLSAEGTSSNYITFTSNKITKAAGDYEGLIYYGATASQQLNVKYCNIQYATSGIHISSYNDGNYHISYCVFENNVVGINPQGINRIDNIIEYCQIKNNKNGLIIDKALTLN